MTTEMLAPEMFVQVAMYYLDSDDGSGAASVRVDQMLESRRENRITGIGLEIMQRLSKTRSTEAMATALQHPCAELRDLALTEIEKFRMPKQELALKMLEQLQPDERLFAARDQAWGGAFPGGAG